MGGKRLVRTKISYVTIKLDALVTEIQKSTFFEKEFLLAINKCCSEFEVDGSNRVISKIVCYGLGSFSDGINKASLYQLALLILLHGHLKSRGHPINDMIDIFDPIFKPTDKEILSNSTEPSFNVLEVNEFCGRDISQECDFDKGHCTLFYMPHCDQFLYNNLIGRNWSLDGIGHTLVLGNSFSDMLDNPYVALRQYNYYLFTLASNFSKTICDKKQRTFVSMLYNRKLRFRRKNRALEQKFSNYDPSDQKNQVIREYQIDVQSYPDVFFGSLSLHFASWQNLLDREKDILELKQQDWKIEENISDARTKLEFVNT